MNLSQGRSRLFAVGAAIIGLAAGLVAFNQLALAAGQKLDVEIPFDIKPLQAPGLNAPYFVQAMGDNMVVSDRAGGVFTVTFDGKVTPLADKSKIKHPGGLAVAPAGFGSYAGQVFVMASEGGDKTPCAVDRIDSSGAVTKFADLPDSGGAPTDCRGLEFGRAGSPFAGKLYAATSGNSTIYSIDPSGKATIFGSYRDPMPFDLTTIGFAPASDPKAPNAMLVGMHVRMGIATKVGRIAIIGPDGKMGDVYQIGFIRPSGFAMSPDNFGTYPNEFFIADTGKYYAENKGQRDGLIARVEKGAARTWATGLMDPTDLKFIGGKLVICDPAERGVGGGSIVIISSMM
ncbi:MAG TPA: hypothetical protein VMU16_03180 [Candidatus Binataceae bacterium]|nr:hypothetical protein [Candidatus Binataceae bacterium]